MPKKDTYINFKNCYKKLPHPFVVHADFECFAKPMNNCEPDSKNSFTMEYQKHEPCGFCLYIKPLDTIKVEFEETPIVYTKKSEDEDIAKIFLKNQNQSLN